MNIPIAAVFEIAIEDVLNFVLEGQSDKARHVVQKTESFL